MTEEPAKRRITETTLYDSLQLSFLNFNAKDLGQIRMTAAPKFGHIQVGYVKIADF